MGSGDDGNALSPVERTGTDDTHDLDTPLRRVPDKVAQIIDACTKSRDLNRLITLSTAAGGLINDEVRQLACKFKLVSPFVHD